MSFAFPFSMLGEKCKCFISAWRVSLPVYTSLYSALSESAPCLLQGVLLLPRGCLQGDTVLRPCVFYPIKVAGALSF